MAELSNEKIRELHAALSKITEILDKEENKDFREMCETRMKSLFDSSSDEHSFINNYKNEYGNYIRNLKVIDNKLETSGLKTYMDTYLYLDVYNRLNL
jgi:hypothetical protein